ncbi:ABC transporter ATP-binding protein [bacterium 1XD42-1]|nr:ABC transporter ATP-binding protein [bacterium 1XD42-8]RKJ65453.1 ABC transporter ATP-binding protein [bacterium 1XD42-1]
MPRKMRDIRRPQNMKNTICRIFHYIRDYRIQFIFVLLGILGGALANIIGTSLLKPLINLYIVPWIGSEQPELSGFISLLVKMGTVFLVGVFSTYLFNRLMLNISTGALYKIRTDLFDHMEKLPIQYYDTHTHGELMSRFTNDVDTLREMLSQGLPQLISALISIVGVFIMMLLLSPVLTFLVVLMLVIMLQVIKYIGSRSGRYFQKQQAALGKVNGYIEEMIEGQKVVKVFCRENQVEEEFETLNEALREAASNANTYANVLMPIMGNLSHINYAITAAAGALMVIGGFLDLGTIAAFLQYSRNFGMPITQVSQQFNNILNALAGAERIFNLIDVPEEVDNGYVTLVRCTEENGEIVETQQYTGMWAWKHPHSDGTLTYTRLQGDVRFEDVTFSYDGKKDVLKNISLYAKPGQKIAFVGSTGAGKTTITNLINRFYDVPDGKIRYDGININKIRKDDLRRSLGMVLQDTHLFTGTVKENIRYGNLEATDEEILRAAKLANADGFIRHLPQGYDTVLTADGANLSQGQRQLLAIARAAVANPPVLILDEATSSIDTRTEALIEKGMDTLMEGRTVFVIAHRLSTVRNSDAIMVLENGQIIERGDHDQLLAEKGKYFQLYTGMFELS